MKKIFGMFFSCIGNAFLAVILSVATLGGIISGLICKARGKKWQTFTREVEDIGVFNAQGTSEKGCGCWTHTFDFGPFQEVELTLSSKMMKKPAELAVVREQFKAALANADKVVAAVKESPIYKEMMKNEGIDVLVPQKEVYAELHTASKYQDPYMAVFFATGKWHIWISIQDGKMTGFDVSEK